MSNGRYMFAPSEIFRKSYPKILEVVHSSETVVFNDKRIVWSSLHSFSLENNVAAF